MRTGTDPKYSSFSFTSGIIVSHGSLLDCCREENERFEDGTSFFLGSCDEFSDFKSTTFFIDYRQIPR